jgi:hypothetical protein
MPLSHNLLFLIYHEIYMDSVIPYENYLQLFSGGVQSWNLIPVSKHHIIKAYAFFTSTMGRS